MWAHKHMARERSFDKTTDRQALLPEFVRLCFLCGFGPGSSKRNWVRSLMACARIRPFCRQSDTVAASRSPSRARVPGAPSVASRSSSPRFTLPYPRY